MTNLQTGNYGETLACKYLESLGYKIIERNFRIRGGEVDIIAMEGEYLIFVEVKARHSHEYGLPVESITPWKIKALKKSAAFYCMKIDWGNKPYRIDMVSIDFAQSKQNPKIELIKDITEF